MTDSFYHRCPIKNLSPEGPSDLTSIEEQLLFTKLRAAMKRRGWKMDWLEIDFEKHVFHITHESITHGQELAFYDEIFSGIGKDVLDHDEDAKKLISELAALEDSAKEEDR